MSTVFVQLYSNVFVLIENIKKREYILTVVVKGDVRAFAEAMEKDETEKRTGDEEMQTD